jgi:hypothetical protein
MWFSQGIFIEFIFTEKPDDVVSTKNQRSLHYPDIMITGYGFRHQRYTIRSKSVNGIWVYPK